MRALLQRHPEVTAVFCMSDMLALGAMRAAHEMGAQVPGTISVIGVDGLELGAFSTPQLASIRQPQEAIADQSVKQLLAQIERGARARTTVLPVALEAGESVAARPQS
jgi:LacI family transcriptional regulator